MPLADFSTRNYTLHTLVAERKRAAFQASELSHALLGQNYLDRQAKIVHILTHDPIFSMDRRHFWTRQQELVIGFRMAARIIMLKRYYGWDDVDEQLASQLVDMPSTLMPHTDLVLACLQALGNDAQHDKFLKPAQHYEIITCYAQTELGHGSNVQGIETTATYDARTEEFVLHSPTLTSHKWWVGGLGMTATHAIVMAQLHINRQSYGVHAFVAPIRSRTTHTCLSGVTIGHIGPKFGLHGVDSGYLRFHHYRVPRDHMLARFAQVTAQGQYCAPANSKVMYSGMVHLRHSLVHAASVRLAKASTIAIRYCIARRQFNAGCDQASPADSLAAPSEAAVLDYSMVQYRLFPVLSHTYALHFTGKMLHAYYLEHARCMARDDFSNLAEIHALSSCLKAMATDLLLEGVEGCRRAMGGHGYSRFSGLYHLYGYALPQVTLEGDNYVLSQQTARFLVKTLRMLLDQPQTLSQAVSAASSASLTAKPLGAYLHWTGCSTTKALSQYLGDHRTHASSHSYWVSCKEQLLDIDHLVQAFGHRAAYLASMLLCDRTVRNHSLDDLLGGMHRAHRAYGQYVIMHSFAQGCRDLAREGAAPPIVQAVLALCQLAGLIWCEASLVEFFDARVLAPHHSGWFAPLIRQVLKTLRPDILALVEGWALPDYALNSALGEAQNDVYDALLSNAQSDPLNAASAKPFNGHYQTVLQPFMRAHQWLQQGEWRQLAQYEVTRPPQQSALPLRAHL
ncbi:hypothetical protein H4R34_004154 [Dimargaris verticillata]|uniref:Acyl-coenzyme A oxidase n=1 Tax=Dimargaris verticillata TaxID=2761393 RepID=A0A9W8AZI0_9FUNG|nr:hypothetical protein H4R34_004154 [Dimargaris verticillata]